MGQPVMAAKAVIQATLAPSSPPGDDGGSDDEPVNVKPLLGPKKTLPRGKKECPSCHEAIPIRSFKCKLCGAVLDAEKVAAKEEALQQKLAEKEEKKKQKLEAK